MNNTYLTPLAMDGIIEKETCALPEKTELETLLERLYFETKGNVGKIKVKLKENYVAQTYFVDDKGVCNKEHPSSLGLVKGQRLKVKAVERLTDLRDVVVWDYKWAEDSVGYMILMDRASFEILT